MTVETPAPTSIDDAIAGLRFLADRTPTTTDEESAGAFAQLSTYRDGGIYVGHWAGASEWERHPAGDEIVMVLGGETTLYLLTDQGEQANRLGPGNLLVVPQGTWHRFETPDEVKVFSVSPQPSDHQAEHPG